MTAAPGPRPPFPLSSRLVFIGFRRLSLSPPLCIRTPVTLDPLALPSTLWWLPAGKRRGGACRLRHPNLARPSTRLVDIGVSPFSGARPSACLAWRPLARQPPPHDSERVTSGSPLALDTRTLASQLRASLLRSSPSRTCTPAFALLNACQPRAVRALLLLSFFSAIPVCPRSRRTDLQNVHRLHLSTS